MEEEFYKFVSPAEIAKDLNLPKELATKIHKYWALKRKVLYIPFNRKQITQTNIQTDTLELTCDFIHYLHTVTSVTMASSSRSKFYSNGCLVYTVLSRNTNLYCL